MTTAAAAPVIDGESVERTPADSPWREMERHLVRLVLAIVGFRYAFHFGATYGDVVAIFTVPLWFSAFRRYRKNFSVNSYADAFAGRRLTVLQNIYQSLLFE